jgi:hypothetical protein
MVACHCDRRCDRYHCVFVCGRDSGGTQTPEPIELPRPTFHGYAWEGLPPAVGAVRADHDPEVTEIMTQSTAATPCKTDFLTRAARRGASICRMRDALRHKSMNILQS